MRASLLLLAAAAGLAAAQKDEIPPCVETCISRAVQGDANEDVYNKCTANTQGAKTVQCVCKLDTVIGAYQTCFEKECAGVAAAAKLDQQGLCTAADNGALSASSIERLPVAAAAGLVAGTVLFF